MSGRQLLAVTHEHANGRRRGKHLGDAVSFHNFPSSFRLGPIDGSLAKDGGDAGAERAVDDVAMAVRPADVGSAPENISRFNVEERTEMVGGADHVSAVNVNHALGTSRGAAGVKNEERIFGVHLLCRRLGGELEKIKIIDLALALGLVNL